MKWIRTEEKGFVNVETINFINIKKYTDDQWWVTAEREEFLLRISMCASSETEEGAWSELIDLINELNETAEDR